MKITLLGTGADHCIPAFRCNCPVCNDARERGISRQNSCASIELDTGEVILIDMPPQIMMMLSTYKIPDLRISSVLVTHRHGDHTLGLRYLFQGKTKKGFVVKEPVNLYITDSAYRAVSKVLLADKDYDLFPEKTDFYRINFIDTFRTFNAAGLEIIPLETNHLSAKISAKISAEMRGDTPEPSLGFLIKNRYGKGFGYLLDASKTLPKKTLDILRQHKLDCLVIDCTYEHSSPSTGHFDVEGVIGIKEELNPDRLIISHVSHKNLSFDELTRRLSHYNIEVSYDGMVIKI